MILYIYREREREILTTSSDYAWVYEILQKTVVKRYGILRHGHEMLWFSRGYVSESEVSLSCNAKVMNARASN